MLFYPLKYTTSANSNKYLGSLLGFLKSKFQNNFSYEGSVNNFVISLIIDSIIEACEDKIFKNFDEIQNSLIKDVANNSDFYSFSDGYILAKNFSEHKIDKACYDTAIKLNNTIYTNLQKFSKTNFNLKSIPFKANNSFANLFYNQLKQYIQYLSDTKLELDNLTLNEYIQLKFAHMFMLILNNDKSLQIFKTESIIGTIFTI